MKNFFKKTTTKTAQHIVISRALITFITKHLGKQLNHMRIIQKETRINDATFLIFAKGKITTLQDTKVFIVAKHHSLMILNNTMTLSLMLDDTLLLIKTLKFNPFVRTWVSKGKSIA